MMQVHADELLLKSAETFKARREVYGYNYLKVGGVMTSLFPDGVTLKTQEDFIRFELLMMKVVKLSRYAENWSKGGHEDSLTDDAVYSQMLNAVDMDICLKKEISEEDLLGQLEKEHKRDFGNSI